MLKLFQYIKEINIYINFSRTMSNRHFANYNEDKILKLSEINSNSLIEHALNILNNSINNMPPIEKNHDGGLYVGFVGLGYALLHLSKSSLLLDKRIQLLNQAKYFIEQELKFYKQKKRVKDDTHLSFLLGYVGTLSLAIEVYKQLDIKDEATKFASEFIDLGKRFVPIDIHHFGSDELFVGRSGYLIGYSFVRRSCEEMSLNIPKDLLYEILDSLVASGQKYSQKHRSRSPLMYSYYNTEYLGAAHGLTGILFALMKFPDYLNDRPATVTLISQCLDYMISVTPANGNLPPATDDIGRKQSADSQLTHWCHGAAGAVYAYALAFRLWGLDKYLQAAKNCGELIWKYGLLKKGPGICHGIAGSGYVFLLLYRLTMNEMFLHRANCFWNFLSSEEFKYGARVPDSPYSLFEGWAGTACFVADLATPNTTAFPFFDVFD